METLQKMIERLKGCRETMSNPWDIVMLWEQNAESILDSVDCDLVNNWQWFARECKRAISAGTPLHVFASRDETLDECAAELETWLAVNLPRIKTEERELVLREEFEPCRIKLRAEARLEEARKLWSLDFTDAYNGGYLTEKGRDYLRKRVAELTEEKETR